MTDWLTRKAEAEREWFKKEHERQFGKPPSSDQDVALSKVVAKFERLSRKKVCERKHFVPKVELPPPLVQIEWDAPLALHCVCPTGDCSCTCKGNTLLPRKRLPIIPRYNWWGVRPVLCKLHIAKRPKPAGDLARNFAEAVKKESAFYKSKQGREILTERGPEFCLSGCLKFYITNKKIQKDFVKVIGEMKSKVVTSETPMEVQEEQVTKKELSDRICDQFRCTVSTQSQVDGDGEFIIGDYSHLLFGTPEEEFLCDIEGAELNVASYRGPVCVPPDSVFLGVVKTADKLFHVTDIKQRISQVKKDLITSIFEIRERHLSKASQYECNDLPMEVPEGVCESLADVRRKRRVKDCLEKNKVPVEEEVKMQDATCYCKFRYKQVPKVSGTVKKSKEENELPQPVKPTPVMPPAPKALTSKSNLEPFEESPCPPCVIKVRSKIRENKSLSDADKRVKIDLSQTGKGSKDKAEIEKQTSFIGSLKVSYNESINFKNDKMSTIMPEEGKKIGVRFSKEVATDIVPEFYENIDDDFDIVSQESSTTQMDNIVEPFKDQHNQTSVELLNKVMKDASMLVQPEKTFVHKTISIIRSVELVILRPDAKCAKGNILTDTSGMRVSSCTPCNQEELTKSVTENENNVGPDNDPTQPQEALKPINELKLKDSLEISDDKREENVTKLPDASQNIKDKSEIETESLGKILLGMKKTYKDGACQPCDKLLKIAKYINKALSEPSQDAESKELQQIGNIRDKIKSTGKISPPEGASAFKEKLKDTDTQVQPLAGKSIDVMDSKDNFVKKESKTDEIKVSSTEHKVPGTLTEKNSSKDSFLQLTKLEKEAPMFDELNEISSKSSKIDFQPHTPSSKGRISELAEMKAPKTGKLKKESSTDSNIDVYIRKPSSEDKVLGTSAIEKHVSKIDEFKDELYIESKTVKPSSKDRVSVTAQEKQRVSKTDELEHESITKSDVDTHKVRSQEDFRDVKKVVTKADKVMEASSIESKIDSSVHKPGSKGRLSPEERKHDESEADLLKDVPSTGSKIDTQTYKPSNNDELPELIEVKKEVSKTDNLQEKSSRESKMDLHDQHLGSKGKEANELENVSSTGSKVDTQTHKPSSTEGPLELTDGKKEISKIEELKKTSSIESKIDSHDQKLGSKGSISKPTVAKRIYSKTDELEDISSTQFKVDTQSHKLSRTEVLSELPHGKKELSKTENLKETSSIESKTDFQRQELGRKGRVSEAEQRKEVSKFDEIKNTSITGSKIATQTRRPSEKGGPPESLEVTKEASKTADLKKDTSIISKTDSQIRKPRSKDRHSETAEVKLKVFGADELKDISSTGSRVDAKTHILSNSEDGLTGLIDVKKELSKTEELKDSSSIGSKMHSQAQKLGIDERLSELTKVIKEVSKTDEFKDVSSTLCKINSKTKKPSCMGRFSELSELNKVPKTEDFKHGSTHIDTQTRKQKSKGWFSKLIEKIKEKSKAFVLKDLPRIMHHSNSEAQKPSSKDRLSKVKKEVSKTDELHVVSSIMCHSDSETRGPSSKGRLSALADRKKDKSGIDDFKKTSSVESKLDTRTEKPGSKGRISKLEDREREISRTENLKDISSMECKVDTQIKKPGSKGRISNLIEREKEISETDNIKDISSVKSKEDFEIKKTGSMGGISEFADRKKKKSGADESQEMSSRESKGDTEIQKPGSKSGISEFSDREKKKFGVAETQEISSIESKGDTQIKKPGSNSGISELAAREKKKFETAESQEISSIESKGDPQIEKPGGKSEISEVSVGKKKKSEANELQEISSTESKVDTQIQKPGSKSRISEFDARKKKESEAGESQEISNIESKGDIQIKKPSSKSGISEFLDRKNKKSEADESQEISSIELKGDTQIQKPSSKSEIPEHEDRKNKKSKAYELQEISSIESKIDTHILKPGSKSGILEFVDRKKKKSEADGLQKISSLESKIDTHIKKPGSTSGMSEFADRKMNKSEIDKLHKISSIESKVDSKTQKPSSKGNLSELAVGIKEKSKTDNLKETSSMECEFETQNQKASTKGRLSDLTEVKKEISTNDTRKISGTESEIDTQTQKPSSKDALKGLMQAKKEVSKAEQLKEVFSIESKEFFETRQPSSEVGIPDLKEVKEEPPRTEKFKGNLDPNVETHSPRPIIENGSQLLTEVAKGVSKSQELMKASSIESKLDSKSQKLTPKEGSTELTKVKKEVSKTDNLSVISKTKINIDTQSHKLGRKDGPELTKIKKEVSDTDELKELYSTNSNIDAKIEKPSSKQILPNIKEIKTEVSKTDQLKMSPIAESDVSTQTQKSSSKGGPSKLADVIKEASKTDELKAALSEKSDAGTQIKKPSSIDEVPRLTGIKKEQTKMDDLKKISSTESKTDIQKQSTKKALQEKQKQEGPDMIQGPGISKGTTGTARLQGSDAKNVPKETKQESAQVAGPCPVKKLTNLKNTIKRYLVPEDIPKICKDAACQPCHKLKGLEKVVHEAFSDLEHSEMKVIKGNTEKESDAKKKADLVISQISTQGNNGRINVFNQTLSTEFAEAPLGARKLDETTKILESYIINSGHKLDVNSRLNKSDLQKANENSVKSNKIIISQDFYLSPLEKLIRLKDFIKSYVIPTRPKTCVDSTFRTHEKAGEFKKDVDSVISPFRAENVTRKIEAVNNTPRIKLKNIPQDVPTSGRSNVTTISNNKTMSGKSVPILKLGPPYSKIKSSEKVKQSVSFKDSPEYNCEECNHCKSCDECCSKSQKKCLSNSESFNKNLGAYNVTSHEKLNSVSITKRGAKKSIRKIYNKMSHFDWKALFSYPLGNKNLEIDQVLSECFDATKPGNINKAEFKNVNLKFSEEEMYSRDLESKKNDSTDLKSCSTNKDCDMIVREVVYDNKQYYGNVEGSVSSTQNLNKSYRFYY